MMSTLEPRVVIIYRETRLNELKRRYNTLEQAKFYIEHLGADFQEYSDEDAQYASSLKLVENNYRTVAKVQLIERSFLPNFVFNNDEIVVVVGQDGLVANTLKYVKTNSVVGINPEPSRYDGKLLPFNAIDSAKYAKETVSGYRNYVDVTLASVNLSNGQKLVGVNDIFIGPRSHTSARYNIKWGNHTESQSSSGIIVSTGLGSTGWFQSLIAGAVGVTGNLNTELTHLQKGFEWSEDYLYFCVREPFPSQTTGTDVVFGKTSEQAPLSIESHMPENGVIFSDGILDDYIDFHAGLRADIGIADWKARLIV